MNSSKIWERISETAEDNYFLLSSDERIAYNLKNIIDAVNDNGLLSYYKSHCADYAEDAVEDLNNVGMYEVASIIENANALFPGGCPDEDLEERLEIIDSWEHEYDSLYEQWTEDILEFSIPLEETLAQIMSKIK